MHSHPALLRGFLVGVQPTGEFPEVLERMKEIEQ
jgi:hypothetical protein